MKPEREPVEHNRRSDEQQRDRLRKRGADRTASPRRASAGSAARQQHRDDPSQQNLRRVSFCRRKMAPSQCRRLVAEKEMIVIVAVTRLRRMS